MIVHKIKAGQIALRQDDETLVSILNGSHNLSLDVNVVNPKVLVSRNDKLVASISTNGLSTKIEGGATTPFTGSAEDLLTFFVDNDFFFDVAGGSESPFSRSPTPPTETEKLWFNTVDSNWYYYESNNDTFGSPVNAWLTVNEFKGRYANTNNISGTVFLFPYGNSGTGFLDTYALTDSPCRLTRAYMNAKFNSVTPPVTFEFTEILPTPVSQTYVFNYTQKTLQEFSLGFFPKIAPDNLRITFTPSVSAINVNLDIYYRKEYVAT